MWTPPINLNAVCHSARMERFRIKNLSRSVYSRLSPGNFSHPKRRLMAKQVSGSAQGRTVFSIRVIPAIVILFMLLLTTGCGKPEVEMPATPPPPSVTVIPASRIEVIETVEGVGQTQATEEVEIRARVEGFLAERKFLEGSDVDAGALLFVIEQASYQIQVKRVEAELAKAKAEQTRARSDLTRIRKLRERRVASQSALDEAVASEQKATADVLARKAELSQAELDLSYTTIRAPFDGRTGRSEYSIGDLVDRESAPLTTLVALDPIYVYWRVSEQIPLAYRRRLHVLMQDGKPMIKVTPRLKFTDGSFYEHEGRVDFLDNRVDPATGTQKVRAVFPNPDKILLPGQYVSVVIEVGDATAQLVIPQAAVQQDRDGYYVLVIDSDNRVALRRVTLGARQGVDWIVEDGVLEGEQVIVQGSQKVRPGVVVAPVFKEPERSAAE